MPLDQPRPEEQPDRRTFLGQVTALTAAGAASAAVANAAPHAATGPELLPTIKLGRYDITRLILGGNPIYGHSHFNKLYSQQLIDFHTPQRVVELLQACSRSGINTWQNSYTERTVQDVQRCREAGIDFHWLLLGKHDWVERPELIEVAAAHQPIGIAPHGSSAERLHQTGKLSVLRDMLKRIRQTGVLVGLSGHNPEVIEVAEEQQWDVDYYMCCLYYLTRPKEELEKMLGEVPMGEVYLPSDRQRMLEVIRQASKPCLAYKILAAGRAELSPGGVKRTLGQTLQAIKPTDGMIVGMFQQFGDQVAMNARFVRELAHG